MPVCPTVLPMASVARMKDSQFGLLKMNHRKSILPTMTYLVNSTPGKDHFLTHSRHMKKLFSTIVM